MKLLTKEIIEKLPALRSTDGQGDEAMVVAKFFTPDAGWTWYVMEGEKQPDGDYLFFGLVTGIESELGYFSLRDLACTRGPLGLEIERDIHWTPKPLGEVRARA